MFKEENFAMGKTWMVAEAISLMFIDYITFDEYELYKFSYVIFTACRYS